MSAGASVAFEEIMKSNVRPKCDIRINVVDVSGDPYFPEEIEETVLFSWTSSEIVDLKFSSEIDPFGRALPHMELKWKEIYDGDLTEELYPEKYQNIFPFLAVDLEFIQDLDFFSTWKALKESGTTWKNLKESAKTWKQVKNDVLSETVKMPRLFLKSKPLYEKNTVTWIATDSLSFMDDVQIRKYYPISLMNVIPGILITESSAYQINDALYIAYTRASQNIATTYNLSNRKIGKELIYTGKTNELLLNYASFVNHYIYFEIDGSFAFYPIGFDYMSDRDFHFKENLLYDLPKTTRGTDISDYIFDASRLVLDVDNKYDVSDYEIYSGNPDLAFFHFKGYGTCQSSDNYGWVIGDDLTYAIGNISGVAEQYRVVTVTPVNIVSDNYSIKNSISDVGDVYEEKNPLNPYDQKEFYLLLDAPPIDWATNSERYYIKSGSNYVHAQHGATWSDNTYYYFNNMITYRYNSLVEYFQSKYSTFEFSCLPNVDIQPGDVIEVDTLFFDENGERKESQAFVCKIEITYNGAIKEKIIAHEVSGIGKG